MKNKFLRMISFGLSVCLLSALLPAFADTLHNDYEEVEVWRRTDIILKSEKKYGNPYKDVELDAVFTHEDGTKIALYGFWNGGDEWRVRFAPTKVGVWSYEITCSDTENISLHGQTGKLLAVKNTGNTDLDKHGFVRISDNGRYFVYDDGTPFYWLGDTNWQAPNYVSITQCNYPGCLCGNQFLHEVNDRIAKGFTVYQTYFDSAESDGGGQRDTTTEPSMWSDKFDSVNPETFTKKFDVMFDHLADRGMVIALGFGVHSNTTQSMSKADLDRISRYLTARYASYPVVWITAQEITGSPQFNMWNSSAKIVDAGDGYNHPQGAHQFPLAVSDSYVANLDRQSWHEFYALQAGHGPTFPSKSLYEGYWNNTRSGKVKPFVETEANYEDIICGGFNGYDASRIAAWKANLCGSYGFTYGATGVWANNYSTAGNTGWLGSFSYEPWYMGIDKPGSFEMTYLANFFRYVDFSTLIPRFNNSAYSDLTEETKVVASSGDGKTYAAYFYNSTTSTGTLKGLNPGEKYSAKWYNPLTGKFVEISDEITVTNGEYVIPDKPTTGDWALLVTSRTDLGEYATEKAYTDPYLTTRNNFALGGSATASSNNGTQFSPFAAIDGNMATYWCAKDGSMPQWFVLDMKTERNFAEIELILHAGNETRTEYASFTVEGSRDGEKWESVATVDKAAPTPYQGKDLFRVTKDGSYRYLRVTFTEIRTNWATLYEIAVYDKSTTDATDTGSGALPTYDGVRQTPGVTSVGSYIYNAAGKGRDTIDALFDDDLSTEWKPYAPIGSQTILMDLRESKALYGIQITLGKNAALPKYRIEGSADGVNWTILADATLRDAQTYNSGDRTVVSEALSGEYRYVKLLWLNGSSNSVVKTIAGIALYAEGGTPAAAAAADTGALLTLYNEVRGLNNSDKTYTAVSFRALSLSVADVGKLLANPENATEADVADAQAALRLAYEGLVKTDAAVRDPDVDIDEKDPDNPGGVSSGNTEEKTDDTANDSPQKDASGWILPVCIAGAAVAAVFGAATGVRIFLRRKKDN